MKANKIITFIIILFISSLPAGKYLWNIEAAEDDNRELVVDQTLDSLESDSTDGNAILEKQKNFPTPSDSSAQIDATLNPDAVSSQESVFIPVLDLQNTDIQGALDTLEKKSGLTFITEEDTQSFLPKRVNLYLENIDVWDALKILLAAPDLAFASEKNIVHIMTADAFVRRYKRVFSEKIKTRIIPIRYRDEKKLAEDLTNLKSPAAKVFADYKEKAIILIGSQDDLNKMAQFVMERDIPLQTKVFPLDNVTVKDLKEKIEKLLTKNVGQLEYDINANKIIITDTVEKLQVVQTFIQQVDKPIEISMGSQIIQVQLSEEKIKGIDWEAIVSHYHNLDAGQTAPAKETRGLSVGTISKDDFQVLMEALETVGEVNVVSSPAATISNRKDIYLQLHSGDSGTTVTMTTSPARKDAPTPKADPLARIDEEFYVTPYVRAEPPISLTIVPVNHSEGAKTELDVREGDVVVMGGIFREQQVSSVKKFPLLGDLPLLGLAFRKQGTKMKRMEYVIFLMPKILSSSVQQ